MALPLEDAVAIVTGAGSGLGRAIAAELAARGARVHCADRSGAQEQTAKQIGDAAAPLHLDVTSVDQWAAAVQQVEAADGAVDILCGVAGVHGPQAAVGEYPVPDWDEVFDVNARAVFLGIRAVLPGMVARRRGSIVSVGSMAGVRSVAPFTVPYAASKAAVVALTQGVAAEYGPAGIRANCVAPGTVTTPMNPDTDRTAFITSQVPLRRKGEPREIATAVAFLAGPDASYVNGETLVVDGGYTVKFPGSNPRNSAVD